MVDGDLILAKVGLVRKHLTRVEAKAKTDLKTLLEDLDRQESIAFNLQLAIQNCVDIAAHIIAEEGYGVPGAASELFYLLQENGYLSADLTEKMIGAVGFRNLIVHEYGKMDLTRMFEVAQQDAKDLNDSLATILTKLGLKKPSGN